MMEFTSDGIVRWGFGFYNPNHAAALITLLFPLLWPLFNRPGRWPKVVAGIAAAGLIAALALTGSRTGMAVLVMEMVFFCCFYGRRFLKYGLAALAVLVAAFALSGMLGRFGIDRALTNRPVIWRGGAELFSLLPGGCGLGDSGRIVSEFLLPEGSGIVCRTLVNSHLTWLVEFGAVPGVLYVFAVLVALFRLPRRSEPFRPALWCAVVGTLVSATLASCFDWPLLFDFYSFGTLPLLNWLLSWLLLLGFCAAVVLLWLPKVSRRRLLAAAGTAVAVVAAIWITGWGMRGGSAPELFRADGVLMLRLPGKDPVLALYDREWTAGEVAEFIRRNLPEQGAEIPLDAWAEKVEPPPASRCRSVLLFGRAADWADRLEAYELHLAAPPENMPLPERTRKIYVGRYVHFEAETAAEVIWY